MRIRELLKGIFLPSRDMGNCTKFAYNSRDCGRILMKIFEGCDVSLATNYSMLEALNQITIRIKESLAGIFATAPLLQEFAGTALLWRRFTESGSSSCLLQLPI